MKAQTHSPTKHPNVNALVNALAQPDNLNLPVPASIHSTSLSASVAANPAPTLQPSAPVPNSPGPAPIDPVTAWRIQSLQRKQRADSFFNSLSPEESSKVIGWFNSFKDIGDVYDRIVAPPPEGLGRKISWTSLRRLRASFHALVSIGNTEQMLDSITDMELESDLSQTARIQGAINHLLHEKAYELAMTHPGSVVMKDILTSIEKLSALEYRRHKMLLERDRLQRPAIPAPAPTQHHRVELNLVPPAREPAIVVSTPAPPGPNPPLPPPVPPALAD